LQSSTVTYGKEADRIIFAGGKYAFQPQSEMLFRYSV